MATSLVINSTDQGNNKLTKSITNVNPDATRNELVAFADGLNALTTNTIGTVSRVDKTDLTTGEYITLDTFMEKNNDTNNAISCNESTNTITVENSKLPDTTDLADMPSVSLCFKETNIIIPIGQVSIDFSSEMNFFFSSVTINGFAGLFMAFMQGSSSRSSLPQTYSINIPARQKASDVYYNPITITVTVVE